MALIYKSLIIIIVWQGILVLFLAVMTILFYHVTYKKAKLWLKMSAEVLIVENCLRLSFTGNFN